MCTHPTPASEKGKGEAEAGRGVAGCKQGSFRSHGANATEVTSQAGGARRRITLTGRFAIRVVGVEAGGSRLRRGCWMLLLVMLVVVVVLVLVLVLGVGVGVGVVVGVGVGRCLRCWLLLVAVLVVVAVAVAAVDVFCSCCRYCCYVLGVCLHDIIVAVLIAWLLCSTTTSSRVSRCTAGESCCSVPQAAARPP